MSEFYAHTKTDTKGNVLHESEWEPLFSEKCATLSGGDCEECKNLNAQHGHLNKVAYLCRKFAAEMFPEGSEDRKTAAEWGRLAGLWHDLGKFAPEWQDYLKKKADPHNDDVTGKVDHSTAGAQHVKPLKHLGELFSYVIAGHHAGLSNGTQLFNERLKKRTYHWRKHAQDAGVPLNLATPLPPLKRPDAGGDGLAFLTRFLFSCLVDADFLATEAFMDSDQAKKRPTARTDIICKMSEALEDYMTNTFGKPAPTDLVNMQRELVRQSCSQAAEKPSGFFSLTVPTGGGKTLSSLLFALRHARIHKLRRIIYVIPYTSIIQQNADVFRKVFAQLSKEISYDIVLELHSKFDPTKETTLNRLASENWEAPLIVTTNVQFFESLFANRTSSCRKLHRIARSVIIFDEAQALPARLLNPILRSLRCLVHDLHSTAVLCTATQPALEKRENFHIGIPATEITPIIQDEETLFRELERVKPQNLGQLTDDELISHISNEGAEGCLIIVNTTKAAQSLHQQLSSAYPAFHLSARMCPRHIMTVLAKVKRLRKLGKSVVLISTQLIEAGVDISFPVVYRADCGLDSFAQAAGRCNRNGEIKGASGTRGKGRIYLFQPLDHPIPEMLHELKTNAAITRSHVLPNHPEKQLLSLEAIRTYFEHAIWQAGQRTDQWDKPHIVSGDMPCFSQNAPSPFTCFDYARAAQDFNLIDNKTHSIFIPWGRKAQALAQEIRELDRHGRPPNRTHFLRAQTFTIQIYENEWRASQHNFSRYCDGAFSILEHAENNYHKDSGLKRATASDDPDAFLV